MDDVHLALKRTLGLRFKLGLFDPIESQPYWHVSRDQVNTTASQLTNLRITKETLVLLKNDAQTLPFKKAWKVAVIGPHYNAQAELVGNYLGEICPGNNFDCVISPVTAIGAKLRASGGQVVSAKGCELTKNSTDRSFEDAISAAKGADAIVLAMGIGQSIEGESHDRSDIELPMVQHQLVAAIRRAYPDTPTAMFLLNGGMVDIAVEKASVPAILECFYPGFWGGHAIADTLFGDNEHLGGKLPFTVYPADYVDAVKMSDMRMTPNSETGSPGRSYRYYTGTPTYPFGWGLALTTFQLANNTDFSAFAPMRCEQPEAADFEVTVTNTGSTAGDEVVLAFHHPRVLHAQQDHQVVRQLFGFERVHLEPGQSASVSFAVSASTLHLVDPSTGDVICTPGLYELEFTNGVEQSLRHELVIQGAELVLEKFPTY